ncbi:GNAT family N-acetyltransferase [Rossellomorea marisflavi]
MIDDPRRKKEQQMTISILNEHDAEAYQELRLQALQTNPEAFGSTYEREAAFPLSFVQERLTPSEGKFTMGAWVDGDLVGMATFVRETSPKMAHKGNIFGMFVSPDMRGKAVGRSLLEELLQHIKGFDGLEQINLTVVSDNDPAKRLYTSLGFTVFGVEKHGLKFDGCYYDEDWMVKRL